MVPSYFAKSGLNIFSYSPSASMQCTIVYWKHISLGVHYHSLASFGAVSLSSAIHYVFVYLYFSFFFVLQLPCIILNSLFLDIIDYIINIILYYSVLKLYAVSHFFFLSHILCPQWSLLSFYYWHYLKISILSYFFYFSHYIKSLLAFSPCICVTTCCPWISIMFLMTLCRFLKNRLHSTG